MEFSLSAEQRELKEAAAAFARAKLNQDLAKSPLARAGKHVRPSGFRHRVGRAASGPDEGLIA